MSNPAGIIHCQACSELQGTWYLIPGIRYLIPDT
jgi:hypothetical protein